jgi:molecular chaperone HscB
VSDPFAVLGVPRRIDLDERELEQRYLALSRDAHPDHHQQAAADAQAEALRRSAAINDAYRLLRDRWRRAETLVELTAPGAMARTKQLDPEFLGAAIELAEAVATATPGEKPALAARIEQELERRFAAVAQAFAEPQAETAARRLHEARYWRKALADLRGEATHAR